MRDTGQVEALLRDAIGLLEENGFPLAAESLKDNLRAIHTAPTAGARRRRLFQLRDLFEGMSPARDVFFCTPDQAAQGLRFRRSESNRRDEERYRRTLQSIQEILGSRPQEDDAELQVA